MPTGGTDIPASCVRRWLERTGERDAFGFKRLGNIAPIAVVHVHQIASETSQRLSGLQSEKRHRCTNETRMSGLGLHDSGPRPCESRKHAHRHCCQQEQAAQDRRRRDDHRPPRYRIDSAGLSRRSCCEFDTVANASGKISHAFGLRGAAAADSMNHLQLNDTSANRLFSHGAHLCFPVAGSRLSR